MKRIKTRAHTENRWLEYKAKKWVNVDFVSAMRENAKWKSVAGVVSAFVSAFFYTMGQVMILYSMKDRYLSWSLLMYFELEIDITLSRWYTR